MSSRTEPTPFRATREQYLETLSRYAPTWGYGLPAKDYIEREDGVIRQLPFSQKMQCWVLAPSDDPTTLDFYCSLELRPIPILVSIAGAPGTSARGFVVNKLFTPERHRKKGHAKALLEHVHKVSKADGAKLSVLHSDVGDFYSRFGWHIPRSFVDLDTTWIVSAMPSLPSSSSPNPTSPPFALTLDDLRSVLPLDVGLLSTSLSSSPPPRSSPSPLRIAIQPTFNSHKSSITRAIFDAERLDRIAPTTWGFESGTRDGSSWSFITFVLDFPRSTLRILRWRNAEEEGVEGMEEALLRATVEVARKAGVEKVVAWNVEERVLRKLGKEWKGVTMKREWPLGAVAWYGSEGPDGGEGFEWVANEAYGSY